MARTQITQQEMESMIFAATTVDEVLAARLELRRYMAENPDDEYIPEAAETLEMMAGILGLPDAGNQ